MIDFDGAVAATATFEALGAEVVPLGAAAGRTLAGPVVALVSSPRAHVSAMDGYAVRDIDLSHPGARFRLVGEVFAGQEPGPPIAPGETVRVFTGAPIPVGADRVVIQEDVVVADGTMAVVRPGGAACHVRLMGSNFVEGATLLDAGTRLSPRAMIAAAAGDHASVTVTQRPRLVIIATGDELVLPGRARHREGVIPQSVSFGIAALAADWGGEVVRIVHGVDDLSVLQRLATAVLDEADLVIVIGGASVGTRDFAKPMFATHGFDLLFSKVAIKPGKPVWLGRARDKPVLGLPGNPSSAMVTARLLLIPLLATLLGRRHPAPLLWRQMPLATPLPAVGEREMFARARWVDDGLDPSGDQDSSAQSTLADADWLIRRPARCPGRSRGDMVSALLF